MEFIPEISPSVIQVVLVLVLLLFYLGFNFIVLYHLLRFGIGVQPKRIAAIYFIGSSFLFLVTLLLFVNLDIDTFKNLLAVLANRSNFLTSY